MFADTFGQSVGQRRREPCGVRTGQAGANLARSWTTTSSIAPQTQRSTVGQTQASVASIIRRAKDSCSICSPITAICRLATSRVRARRGDRSPTTIAMSSSRDRRSGRIG